MNSNQTQLDTVKQAFEVQLRFVLVWKSMIVRVTMAVKFSNVRDFNEQYHHSFRHRIP